MISHLYQNYFQKSTVFLYPLLQISRKAPFKPSRTYVQWEGFYTTKQAALIVTFPADWTNPQWEDFHYKVLLRNRMFRECHPSVDKTQMIYVFDFVYFNKDYKAVIAGKYSQMQPHARALIQQYFGYNTPEWTYMESFLMPSKYFAKYAELLDVDIEMLQEVGELCAPPDLEKETLHMQTEKIEFTLIN